ncbi:MAG: MBL fold metallo-hydrolase [Actinomycetota bacterium]
MLRPPKGQSGFFALLPLLLLLTFDPRTSPFSSVLHLAPAPDAASRGAVAGPREAGEAGKVTPANAEVTDARARLLGEGWDDPDQIRLRWFGVANFVASFGGHVVLLDGWVPRGVYSGYVPTTVDDLIAVRPEFVYVGHGHIDHMGDVGHIAAATGAKVVASPEACQRAKSDAGDAALVTCVSIIEQSTGRVFSGPPLSDPGLLPPLTDLLGLPWSGPTPWGAVGAPEDSPAGVAVTVIKTKHSVTRLPDVADLRPPLLGPPDPTVILTHPPTAEDVADFTHHASQEAGSTLAYVFRVGDFTLLWHDSSGPLATSAEPGTLEIRKALSGLADVDVEVGGIWEYHQITNGLKDPAAYIAAARPKVFVPTHHDNSFPPFSGPGRAYYGPLVAELGRIPEAARPDLCFIADPDSYRQTLAFTIPEWAGTTKGSVTGCLDMPR